MKEKILVTGASGFIGGHFVRLLEAQGRNVVLALRSPEYLKEKCSGSTHRIGDIDSLTDWRMPLEGCSTVVHLAGLAHVEADERTFWRVNVQGTTNLALQAAEAGVKKFIFVSSIGVHGEETLPERPFNEQSPLCPARPYAKSKLKAEANLRLACANGSMRFVIVRPPLVYGPGCPGNMQRLLHIVSSGVPLPFGSINNQRSLIGIDNLCSFLARCVDDSRVDNQSFVVSDPTTISLPDLLRTLAEGMDCSSLLFPLPYSFTLAAASLLGRGEMIRKLCSSLVVDASRMAAMWDPVKRQHNGLLETAQAYRNSIRSDVPLYPSPL